MLDKLREKKEQLSDAISGIFSEIVWRVHDVADFFSTAPDVEGVDPALQERSLSKLVALKVKRARGEKLSFSDTKKLELSDRSAFPRNSASIFEKREFKIDEEMAPLIKGLNAKEYAYTQGCCAGHITGRAFNDSGFVSIILDSNDKRSEALIRGLEMLCKKESVADPECLYEFKQSDDCVVVRWNWNHPVYRKWHELNESRLMAEDPAEVERLREEGFALYDEMEEATPEAQDHKIHDRHMKFVQKLIDFVGSVD